MNTTEKLIKVATKVVERFGEKRKVQVDLKNKPKESAHFLVSDLTLIKFFLEKRSFQFAELQSLKVIDDLEQGADMLPAKFLVSETVVRPPAVDGSK